MLISVVTPSYRSAQWLKLCIASVADQGVDHEHIIQDSCSDDGTLNWLPMDHRVKTFVEKDQGMYDAVNRGLRRAEGEILGYLNCDEQYLPGALASALDYFQKHPAVEVVFADAIVVDPQGNYLCHRRSCLPEKYHSWVSGNLAILTCATFFRRSVIDRHKLFFNPKLKIIGDAEWIRRLIDRKVPMGLLKRFTAVFTMTGMNLNLLPAAQTEKKEFIASAPAWARQGRSLIILHHRVRRFFAGHYHQKPFRYSLYRERSGPGRVTIEVRKPSFRWRKSTF